MTPARLALGVAQVRAAYRRVSREVNSAVRDLRMDILELRRRQAAQVDQLLPELEDQLASMERQLTPALERYYAQTQRQVSPAAKQPRQIERLS